MGIIVTIVILLAVLVLGGGIAIALMLARSSQQAQKRSATIPGIDVVVPQEWALGHDPEARLHRRIAAVVSSLDGTIGRADVDALQTRAQLMVDATTLDNRLVAIWALPRAAKPAALAEVESDIAALETAATAAVLAPGLDDMPLSAPPTLPSMPLPSMPLPTIPPVPEASKPAERAHPTPAPEVERPE